MDRSFNVQSLSKGASVGYVGHATRPKDVTSEQKFGR